VRYFLAIEERASAEELAAAAEGLVYLVGESASRAAAMRQLAVYRTVRFAAP
jgi:hypothetical protein